MSFSRFSVLAVFLMMIMSAFVAVPTYNVGADEGDYVCYDMDTHEVDWGYETEEECVDAGLMWVEADSGPEDDGGEPEAFHATMTMESLEDWMVDFYAEMPVDWSDDAREDVSMMCADMMGTDEDEITEDCFDHWMDMVMSDGDGHGYDDEFRCPPEMDDATCETLMGCDEGDADMFECMTAMYNYCYDNDSEMCDDMMSGDDDDGGQFIWGIIGYEAGHIDATTLMEEYIIPEFGDFMDGGDDGDDGRPVLYDVQTFDVDTDVELKILTNFLTEMRTTPDFICGSGSVETVPFQKVNDGDDDCEDGSDEQKYDDDGNEINWFDCHDGSEVWINQVNNWEWNCEDGEDEYQEYHHYWWGDVYLFEGDHSAGITDFENLENVAFGNSYCYWGDDNETYVNCDDFMSAEISAGTWSLVTTSGCHQEWDYDDEENWVLVGYDCHGENDNHTNMGSYSHSLGSEGELWFANGSVNHESMEMKNFPYFDTWNNDDKEEFVMYQTQSFSIDTDSSVSIFSAGWYCYDWDEDGVDDDCYGEYPGLYIYHGEDLIASNQHYHSDDMYCPIDSEDEEYSNCGYALLEVDLVAGDYMVYTTFNTHVNQANYYNNIEGAYVVIDGEESDEWDGYMRDNYWEWNEGDGESVMQTVAYDGSVYDLAFEEFWNEAYEFEWDYPRAVEEEFGSVYDLYENYENVLETEGEGCDDCTGNLDTMDAETSFDITSQNEFENWASNYDFDSYYFQFIDDNENGAHDSGEIYAVSSEGSGGNGGEEVLVEGTASRDYFPQADYREYEPECYDEETGEEIDCDDVFSIFVPIFMIAENATHYEDGNITAEEAADNVVELFYMLVEMGIFEDDGDDHDDGHEGEDGVYWIEWSYCEWEGDDWEGDTMWYCTDNDNGNDGFDDWWYYCEVYSDDDGNERWVCTDDFGQHPDYESSAGNTYYKDGGRPEFHDHDEDDNPALLDGIVGVNDPENNEPVPLSENMIGSISDNEGMPLYMGTIFKVHFDGVDDSLETHELYLPIGEDREDWYVQIVFLEGYGVISCDGCEDLEIDGNEAKFRADRPVTITFGLLPDCDHVVGLDDSGYAFEPADLKIKVGETVCWKWTDASDVHNVLELESEFDEDMNLTAVSVGFFSGEPSNTVDFRHTFTEDNMTHYYVCEPHATMGMVGKITVGEGSEEDPVQEIVEESGLPSVGFVVAVLALIGAAGLRRRIH